MTALLTPDREFAVGDGLEPHEKQTVILVVDDSAIDRRVAAAIIEKQTEWHVQFARDGRDALEAIARAAPSIILTDIRMPGLDGLELVQEVRSHFPLTPVVLMTSLGSEDIAFNALKEGAASFICKRHLERDLVGTLELVLAAAERDQRRRQVHDCLRDSEFHYSVTNDPQLVSSLATLLQENFAAMLNLDDMDSIRVGVAFEEALLNSIYHGNLEISSELRRLDGDSAFRKQIAKRRHEAPYRDRIVQVHARSSREEAVCTIRDEGLGFDVATLPDPTDPANLEKPSGRGLLLIRTFMDEVRHNSKGNEITLIKRRKPDSRKLWQP
jgi:CheY-like chemotaxis protein/anti-sigma regulatory factor (Ser/Thr protein kinase)